MATAGQEFETLHRHVLAIDPTIADSLGLITRVREEVHNAFENEYIAIKQWRSLIDELALLHGKALAFV